MNLFILPVVTLDLSGILNIPREQCDFKDDPYTPIQRLAERLRLSCRIQQNAVWFTFVASNNHSNSNYATISMARTVTLASPSVQMWKYWQLCDDITTSLPIP